MLFPWSAYCPSCELWIIFFHSKYFCCIIRSSIPRFCLSNTPDLTDWAYISRHSFNRPMHFFASLGLNKKIIKMGKYQSIRVIVKLTSLKQAVLLLSATHSLFDHCTYEKTLCQIVFLKKKWHKIGEKSLCIINGSKEDFLATIWCFERSTQNGPNSIFGK